MTGRDEIRAAVDRLAEALYELAYTGRFGFKVSTIRMLLTPVNPEASDVRHQHVIDLTPELAQALADAVDQMRAFRATQAPPVGHAHIFALTKPQLAEEIDSAFTGLDLDELTGQVLDDTAPRDRLTVIRAIDDLFGDTDDYMEDEDDK